VKGAIEVRMVVGEVMGGDGIGWGDRRG